VLNRWRYFAIPQEKTDCLVTSVEGIRQADLFRGSGGFREKAIKLIAE
jgi:hypothetical protein